MGLPVYTNSYFHHSNIDRGSFKLCGSPLWASFFWCNYWCLTFCSHLPTTSKIMFWPPQKNDTRHIPTSMARIENTRYLFTSWIWCTTASSAHASYEGYGCNKTNPCGCPTAIPWSTLGYSGVVGVGRVMERRPRLMGAYSGQNSAGGGIWYPGRIAMGGQNWTVYPSPKNQPYHNQPLGASLCSANQPWDGTVALFVATKIMGKIWRLGGVEGMANWWRGGPY